MKQLNISLDDATYARLAEIAKKRSSTLTEMTRSILKSTVNDRQIVTVSREKTAAPGDQQSKLKEHEVLGDMEASLVEVTVDDMQFWYGVLWQHTNEEGNVQNRIPISAAFKVTCEDGRSGFVRSSAMRQDCHGTRHSFVGITPLVKK